MGNLKAWMAIAASAVALAGAQPAAAGLYAEIGDAGDLFNSQNVGPAGMEFNGITGNLNDPADPTPTMDAFAFFFVGGGLFAKSSVNLGLDILEPLVAGLHRGELPPAFPQDPMQPGDPMSPIYTNFGTGVVGWDLLAGNYIIDYFFDGSDPPFTSALFALNPDGTPTPTLAVITAPQAVPEPATAALLPLGLAGLAAMRRHRGRQATMTAEPMA